MMKIKRTNVVTSKPFSDLTLIVEFEKTLTVGEWGTLSPRKSISKGGPLSIVSRFEKAGIKHLTVSFEI